MTPTASPRHPWKALAVALAMFVVVHGARAHVFSHPHGFTHIHIVDGAASDHDVPGVDMDVDEDADDDPDDCPVVNVVDLLDADDWN